MTWVQLNENCNGTVSVELAMKAARMRTGRRSKGMEDSHLEAPGPRSLGPQGSERLSVVSTLGAGIRCGIHCIYPLVQTFPMFLCSTHMWL